MNTGKNRTSMDVQNQIKLLYERGYSLHKISKCLRISRNTVRKFARRQKALEGQALQDRLAKTGEKTEEFFKETGDLEKEKPEKAPLPPWLSEVDFEWLKAERQKGIQFKTLFEELKPPVTYWSFWRRVRALLEQKTPQISMRLEHKPGERVQVDFTDGISLWDPVTGVEKKTQLFVGVLPFSQMTFAVFKESQKLSDFIEAFEAMWTFFGGVTPYVVPDNLKSAVTKAHHYDPDRNKTFCHYANLAGFAVLPARPRHPQDKGAVEVACRILQDQFYQKVRHRRFSSFHELNRELAQFLQELNENCMKDYGVSRQERFQEEKRSLKPLPEQRFEFAEWKLCKVHPDCHIQLGKCLYSVPYTYVGKEVRVRFGPRLVEIFDRETQVSLASHKRGTRTGERMTQLEHWPADKVDVISFDFVQARKDALAVGPETAAMVEYLGQTPYPLQYLRMLQGFLRLLYKGEFSKADLEYAAKIGLSTKHFRLMFLKQCCRHHKTRGAHIFPTSQAPKRDPETLFLHKTIHENK